jgi:thioredoxin reductase
MESETFDVVIIGGGAAGLSAALVLGRARRRVAVVDAGSPRNAPATHMHGFLSRDGMPPLELLAVSRSEVIRYGVKLVDDQVVGIDASFTVRLASEGPMNARRLLVATGLRDELPDVLGLRDRWARDVLHCPYCHGYEVKDRALGVLGWTPHAASYAQIVRQWSDDVVYFAPTGTLTAATRGQLAARGIAIVDGSVRRVLVVDDKLNGIELADGRTISREALFVPPRFVPNNKLLIDLDCEHDEDGWPITHGEGRTSVPGVWVAGNVANPRAQVITAAGEGSAAAIAINADFVEEDIRNALNCRTSSAALTYRYEPEVENMT